MHNRSQFDPLTERNYLQNSIINNQSRLNKHSFNQTKRSKHNFISQKKNVQFKGRNSLESRYEIGKNLASIHRQQIQLKNIQNTKQLINSRLEDEDHLLEHLEKFPYGKQNINIKEDVLERYRRGGDYQDQSRMLEKFRRQAEQQRNRKKSSRKQYRSPVAKFENSLRKYDDKNQLQAMKRKLQYQLDEERRLRQLEQMKMKNISSTLNGLSSQLQNNAFTLEKGIRQLHKKLNDRPKQIRLPKKPLLPFGDTLDLELKAKKIPIVIYKEQPFDARLYFSDVYKSSPKIHPQSSQRQNKEGYQTILKVLKQNNRRLDYLDTISRVDRDYN